MKKFSILFLLLLIATCNIALYSQTHSEDAWEWSQTKRQRPEIVLPEIGVKPGMTIGELGAGRGRYAVILAEAVGPQGKIYANDIHKPSLDYLKSRLKRDHITNINVIMGTENDPNLPDTALDMLFMVNTYHHVEDVVTLMRHARKALKPDGIFALLEANPDKTRDFEHHRTPKDTVLRQMDEAGFSIMKISEILKDDTIYIFELKK